MSEPETAQQKRDRADRVVAAAGMVRQRAAIQAQIHHYEQLRAAAEQAQSDHASELNRIRGAQADLRRAVTARGTVSAPDGRPASGPSAREEAEFDRLAGLVADEERRYALWRDEARFTETDLGGVDRSWSRREPTALAVRIDRLRVAWGVLGARLGELHLTPGEATAAGLPSPEYAGHRQQVEALRARID